jgi:hypothetical protein
LGIKIKRPDAAFEPAGDREHESDHQRLMITSNLSEPTKFVVDLRAASPRFDQQSPFLPIDAGLVAGVFFGRLTRRFGPVPSRRISGPSAEFISVNRLSAAPLPSDVPLFAPMNNPYPSTAS